MFLSFWLNINLFTLEGTFPVSSFPVLLIFGPTLICLHCEFNFLFLQRGR